MILKHLLKNAVFIMGVAIFQQTNAQSFNPDKVNVKASAVYNAAISKAQDGQFGEAKALLLKSLSYDSRYVDVYLSYAGMCGENKQYDSAILMYQKAFAMDSIYTFDYQLPYSINLAGKGRFDLALAAVNNFVNSPHLNERSKKAANYRKKTYEFALAMQQKKGFENNAIEIKNVGDSINTDKQEYYPSLTIDQNMLVFSRRGEGRREDFYKSDVTNGHFEKATLINGDINLEPAKGGLSVSQDGNWMIFAGDFNHGGFGNFDIYISYATDQGWSEPFNMGENINTEFWESSPCLSPDKQALYFSSNRPGGFGGRDLYVSYRKPNGKWTAAENMGPTINTVGDELAPFIHSDNQTLYFTSSGLQGYGGSDLFMSHKNGDGKWAVPQNLGWPINTIDDEGALVVAADARTAYYASNRSDSRGGLDLYTFQLPKAVQPIKTLWVKGKVFDINTKKGLPTNVELKDISTNTVIENMQTDETGNYLITLPIGKDYTFTVNRKGYLFFSDAFEMANNNTDSTYTKDIPLQPVAINSMMELKQILFETNSFKLKPSSFTELDKVLQLLKDNPTLKIQISGHTDNVGKPEDNLKLSTSRAKSVVDYLVSKGIVPIRLSSKGFGSTKPIADNKTEIGKAKNRRTELLVTGN